MTTDIALILAAVGVAVVMLAVVLARQRNRTRHDKVLPKRTRKIHTFLARDNTGRPVFLDVFQEFIDAGARDDPSAQRKGAKHIMTGDGRRVERIRTRRYRVAGTTEVLTSEDPDAP